MLPRSSATRGGDYTLELGVDRPANVGAVTLFIDLPAGMEVLDVQPALANSAIEVSFKQEGRRLNIAWYTLENWNLQAGETMMRIVARGETEGMIGMHSWPIEQTVVRLTLP